MGEAFPADGCVAFGEHQANDGEDQCEDGSGHGLRDVMAKEAGKGGNGPADGESVPDEVASHCATLNYFAGCGACAAGEFESEWPAQQVTRADLQ
jgi:hypothetical protein